VISPEDLVVTKMISGRAKDIEDVEGILAAQESLNTERVRRILDEVDAALGDTGSLARFDAILAQAR
jgi:hypothetical protein